MHALCRFFLEHSGPSHRLGDRTMIPFLVNMPRLYELFVAEWLRANLPGDVILRAQETVTIGAQRDITFEIDLTLSNTATGEAQTVLDTKYKLGEKPTSDDVAQVVAYAEAKHCRDAVLIYPVPLARPLDETVGDIRVRSATFAVDEDLEQAGQQFLVQLRPGSLRLMVNGVK
jgi:5-methylcytosine-specific restriction enzyme subunit McrC